MNSSGEIKPSLDEFKELAKSRRVIPVFIKLMADTFTPVGLYKTLAKNRPGTFLLESAEHGHVGGLGEGEDPRGARWP